MRLAPVINGGRCPTQSLDAAAGVVLGRGTQLFHAYRLDGLIAAMDGKDIERGEPRLLWSLT